MNTLLRDLLAHQVWADAEHWAAIEAHLPAREDPAIHDRLHHLHLVQHGFIWALGDRAVEFAFSKPEEFPTLESLKTFARAAHFALGTFLSGVSEDRLMQEVHIPWFNDPPLTITVTEALTQCAMHSHWHRGQNATRLRELDATPPNVDLIFWYWKGRPAAHW